MDEKMYDQCVRMKTSIKLKDVAHECMLKGFESVNQKKRFDWSKIYFTCKTIWRDMTYEVMQVAWNFKNLNMWNMSIVESKTYDRLKVIFL